jgi:hypothetical protein
VGLQLGQIQSNHPPAHAKRTWMSVSVDGSTCQHFLWFLRSEPLYAQFLSFCVAPRYLHCYLVKNVSLNTRIFCKGSLSPPLHCSLRFLVFFLQGTLLPQDWVFFITNGNYTKSGLSFFQVFLLLDDTMPSVIICVQFLKKRG